MPPASSTSSRARSTPDSRRYFRVPQTGRPSLGRVRSAAEYCGHMLKRISAYRSVLVALGSASLTLVGGATSAFAQSASINAPGVKVELGGGGSDNATALQFFLLLTVLSLVPAILMMVTSFVRITIVLSFVRNAIGAQQMPPNQ